MAKKISKKATKVGKVGAKAQFLTLCRGVLDTSAPVHIQDADGSAFMVLDYKERRLNGPLVDVTAQFFKDNFSRCTSLIRDGVCFRLTLRGRNAAVIARRHTSYADPMDGVLAEWREKLAESFVKESAHEEIVKSMNVLSARQDKAKEELEALFTKLLKGFARIAVGHRPFEEGEMLPGVLKLYRDEEVRAAE